MNIENIIKELNPIDYFIEKEKITLLFDSKHILILNNFDDKIMFSFFINRILMAADVQDENIFIKNFKKYLED